MPDPGKPPAFQFSALRPANKPVTPLVDQPSPLDQKYEQWKKTGRPEHLAELMTAADPIVGKAVTSYAPKSSPAVRSKAKILAKAAFESYTPGKGAKLQTYLYSQLQPLQREAAAYETLHTPEGVRFDMRHVNEAHNRFVEENEREPSDEELADYTGLSAKRLAHIRKFDKMIIGEAKLMPGDDDEDSMSMPATQQGINAWREMVYSELGPRDKLIFDLKTGRNGRVPMGVTEIAAKLKITPGAVSQRLATVDRRLTEGIDYDDVL